jgi:hypothetical protein
MARIKTGDNFGDFILKNHQDLAINTTSLIGQKNIIVISPTGLDACMFAADAIAGEQLSDF